MNQFKQSCSLTCDEESQAFKAKPWGNQSKVPLQKLKVQGNLLKESPKLNINLQRQDERDD